MAEARAVPGHNSDPTGKAKEYVQRFKSLAEDAAHTRDEVKDLTQEAKGAGLDPKALKAVAKRMLEDADKRTKRVDHEHMVDLYSQAVGILD
jgi:uncharacterized protein (UPF0335 family)